VGGATPTAKLRRARDRINIKCGHLIFSSEETRIADLSGFISDGYELSPRSRIDITRHTCRSRQKRRDTSRETSPACLRPSSSFSLARSSERLSLKMEIWPSSGVVDFRAPSHLNLPETQYPLSVRETHGLAGSSGAHCERSCTLLPRVREREMHNSQFARRRARYYFSCIRYMGCSATGLLVEMALLTFPVCGVCARADAFPENRCARGALTRFALDHDLLSRSSLIWNRVDARSITMLLSR